MGSRIGVILVTDLVGSTELRSHLGEEAADQLLSVHDALLRETIVGHGGRVVKGLGDGVLASFDAAGDALNAAVAIRAPPPPGGRSWPPRWSPCSPGAGATTTSPLPATWT